MAHRNRTFATLASLCLLTAACESKPPEPEAAARTQPAAATTAAASTAASAQPSTALPEPDAKLLEPEKANEKAPDTFKVKFHTTKGDFVVKATRDWAPNGVDRFYNLVKVGFFDDIALFRAVKGFVVQFGIHGHPKVSAAWQKATIPDEPVKQGNKRGRLVFAKGGPNSRTTQMFINYSDNDALDKMGFPAVGEVVEGMDIVDSFYTGYGESTTSKQGLITAKGNPWLKSEYPKLDYIKSAEIVE